jgi:hypothetical protein
MPRRIPRDPHRAGLPKGSAVLMRSLLASAETYGVDQIGVSGAVDVEIVM